jgi:tyrosine-protein phosphatase YwqE
MARGKSGRIVVEIDPELKRDLYLELEKKQRTLKEWFIAKASEVVYGEKISKALPSNKGKRKKNR